MTVAVGEGSVEMLEREIALNTLTRADAAGICHPVIGDRVFLATACAVKELMAVHDDWHFFKADDIRYIPFCHDFGPFNLADIHRFIGVLMQKLNKYPTQKIVFYVDDLKRDLTNGVFLLGSYLVLAVGLSPSSAWDCFEPIAPMLLPYRDAAFDECDFDLNLLDCWSGLARAKHLGWIAQIDLDEYQHYDNALEGDLHQIVPGKLIAFKGPQTIASGEYEDCDGRRSFSPGFYAYAFADMNVTTVVRLSAREYEEAEFESLGVRCVGLEFDDGTPTPDVVIAFLHTMRSAPGAVAVHCRASLGRTGTLCALYIMLAHGFTAREAIAWTRIVRPGSVIGDQQHYLSSVEATVRVLQRTAIESATGAAAAAAAERPVSPGEDDAAVGRAAGRSAAAAATAAVDGRDAAAAAAAAAGASPAVSRAGSGTGSAGASAPAGGCCIAADGGARAGPGGDSDWPDGSFKLGDVIHRAVHRISEARRRQISPPCPRQRYESSF